MNAGPTFPLSWTHLPQRFVVSAWRSFECWRTDEMADPRRFLNWRIGRVDEWTLRARLVEGELPRSASVDDAASLKRWVKLETYRGSLFARLGEALFELHFARRSEQRLVYRQLASWSRPFVS